MQLKRFDYLHLVEINERMSEPRYVYGTHYNGSNSISTIMSNNNNNNTPIKLCTTYVCKNISKIPYNDNLKSSLL